jgi:hypothetical protein
VVEVSSLGGLFQVEIEKEIEMIQLEDDSQLKTKQPFARPEQSANVLFNFMSKLDYLKIILLNKAIIPRYYEETIEYLNIDGLKRIAFPMTCFCDIHLNKLVPHMSFYGSFGIGLNKGWGVNKGIQPINYINRWSNLRGDFSLIFSRSLNSSDEEREYIKNYNNYLLTNLLFMKPLDGMMLRSGNYVIRNFHDEREWRYVPDFNQVETELPFLVPQEQLNPKAYASYSDGIRQRREFWLSFEYSVIKYLVVESENDRNELIAFINSEIKVSEIEKFLLISKVLVFNELREDW